MSEKGFLDKAYALDSVEETQRFYDDWSKSYDAEISANGYVTPKRCAEALARFASDPSAPHLDIGCGTGVSGEALRAAGFTTLDGTDLSPDMVEQAKSKGFYRALSLGDLADPFPFETGAYATISAVGVISPGHAPASTLPAILGKLAPGGLFTFSLNDHALEEESFMQEINAVLQAGQSETLFEEYGTHLPGINLKSTVYVLKRV